MENQKGGILTVQDRLGDEDDAAWIPMGVICEGNYPANEHCLLRGPPLVDVSRRVVGLVHPDGSSPLPGAQPYGIEDGKQLYLL